MEIVSQHRAVFRALLFSMPNWKIAAAAALVTAGLLLGALTSKNPSNTPSRETYAEAQRQTATVRTDKGSGSAVVFQRSADLFGRNSRYFAWSANHVTADAESIQLQTYFRYEGAIAGTALFDATILAASTNYDLVLLWINAPPGTFGSAVFADNFSVVPGDQVFAVGNFIGKFDGSVSAGVISQIGITSPARYWAVVDQTTAPIYPGNSGGGLFNSQGGVIGLVVGRFDSTFGLFVPVRTMRAWVQEEGLEWALVSASCPSDVELQRLARIYQYSVAPVVEAPAEPVQPESEQDGLRSRLEP